MYASVAILAALRHRDSGGGGQHVDIALLDTQVAVLANQGMNYLTTGKAPRRSGNGHPNIAPYQSFPTADGHMILAVGNDAQFVRMSIAMGRPEIGTDPRFRTIPDRVAHYSELIPLLESITRTRTLDAWVAAMEAVPSIASPMRLSESPVEYRRAPPQLGEHTAEVLQRVLGLDDSALAALEEKNVIGRSA